MLAPLAPNSLAARNFFLALAILATILFGLQAFEVRPFGHNATPVSRSPIVRQPSARIMKVTERIDPVNELYAASLRSHEEHDRLNGYTTQVFRKRLVTEYNSIPQYLLNLIVDEIEKPPEEERTEWLVWFSGDVVLLNPEIPLEIFLPPADFEHMNIIATQDAEGFNAGVFFVRVGVWSADFMTDVIECPQNRTDVQEARYKHQKAIELSLRSPDFRDSVIYQPRQWFNAYVRDNAARGSLLTHFNSPGGDKWVQMDDALTRLNRSPGSFSVPVGTTEYPRLIEEYWDRLRAAADLLPQGELKLNDSQPIQIAVRRLQYTLTYEPDKETVMRHALVQMKVALGLVDEGDIIG